MTTVKVRVIPIIPKDAIIDVAQLQRDLVRDVLATTTAGLRFIAKYPPQRLTQTGYRRTGTLKRSWSQKVTARRRRIEGVVGSNRNIAPYNEWVQGGKAKQVRRFRRAGWQGVDPLVKRMGKTFDKRVDKTIDKHFGR